MIFSDSKCSLTQHQYIDRFHSAFDDEVPSKTTADVWFAELKRERTNVTKFTKLIHQLLLLANINGVREMIVADRCGAYREVEAFLAIGKS